MLKSKEHFLFCTRDIFQCPFEHAFKARRAILKLMAELAGVDPGLIGNFANINADNFFKFHNFVFKGLNISCNTTTFKRPENLKF